MQYDVRRCTYQLLLVVFGVVGSPGAAAAESPFSLRAEAFYTSDDNVSKSQFDADREEDMAAFVKGEASYSMGFSALSALTFSGAVANEQFMDFDGLSNTEASLAADFRFQPRLAFGAPLYSVFLRATEADFETDIRDGLTIELGGSATKRLTDKITGTLGVTASQREAEGEVFDLERIRYFGNVDWRVGPGVAVYSTLNYIDGDVFSTASPTLAVINWADAIEPDNAFGGAANNKFVYRLDAETMILRAGVNIALSKSASIDVSVDELSSDAAGPIEYDLTAIAAGFLYRF